MKTHTSLLRLALVSSLLVSVGALRAEDKPVSDVVPPSALKKYDKNKDGALDEKERGKWEADKAARREKERAQRAEMLEKYDTNKDGKLSEEERAAAKLGMERTRTEQEGEKMKERAAKQEQQEKEAAAKEAEKAKAKEKEKPAEDTMGGDSMMMN
jgi:hypothetical protein